MATFDRGDLREQGEGSTVRDVLRDAVVHGDAEILDLLREREDLCAIGEGESRVGRRHLERGAGSERGLEKPTMDGLVVSDVGEDRLFGRREVRLREGGDDAAVEV